MSDTNVDTAVDYWYVMQMESFFFFRIRRDGHKKEGEMGKCSFLRIREDENAKEKWMAVIPNPKQKHTPIL